MAVCFISANTDTKMPLDNRKTVRGSISTLASHVIHLLECHWHYGTNAKKKGVNGVVLSVEKRQTNTGWSSNYTDAEYDFGNGTKKKSVLFVLSVREEVAVPAALAAPVDGESHPTTAVHISTQFIFGISHRSSHLLLHSLLHRT